MQGAAKEQSMERWRTATAVVTGANGGIGGALCAGLANAGITVIAVDVLLDRIPELQSDATNGKIIPKYCDISSPKEVTKTFKWVNEEFDGVHILVNCAGVLYQGHITDVGSDTLSDDAIITTIDVNLKGMILCTRHAIASMKHYKIDGHIVNINSVAGHYIPWADNMNVYATTKHAVTAFTATLNTELAAFKNKIKTTSISPGLVSTSMSSYVEQMKLPALQPRDLADAVLYVLSTPPHVNYSMDRWVGKTAVVTGASSGIGAAICVELANAGINVVGLARRTGPIEELKSQVTGNGTITGRKCDVSSAEEVAATFKWVDDSFGCVHIMVNNAGVFLQGGITDVGNDMLSEEDVLSVIDINLKGPILCARHAIASMRSNDFDGHIVNINSIAGHYVPMSSKFNVYTSTKYGITGFSAGLLNELADHKNKIKITSVSPGLVATGIDVAAAEEQQRMPALRPKDVADAVLYVLSTPPTVNINELTITPVTERRL